MKFKRSFCLLLALLLVLPTFLSIPAAYASQPEWRYTVWVLVCSSKDSQTKKGAVMCKLEFGSGDEEKPLENTEYKENSAYAEFVSSRAPWTLDRMVLRNTTTDGFKMYCIYIDVQRNDKYGSPKRILKEEYLGTKGDRGSGFWIDQNDGHAKSFAIRFDPSRTVSGLSDFYSQFATSLFLDPSGESGEIERKWDGKISDDYAEAVGDGSTYDCFNFSDAPTFSIDVAGVKGDNSNISKSDLLRNGYTELENEKGFKIKKDAILAYMNANNINHIKITPKVVFPDGSTKGTKEFSGTYNIVRRTFSISGVNFREGYYKASDDNYFYNNSGSREINVDVSLNSGNNQSHLSVFTKYFSTVDFDGAYLKAGNNIKIYAQSGGKKTTRADVSGGSFTLKFPYESGLDSLNTGLTLEFENAKLSIPFSDGTDYKLWDETSHKLGFSYYKSTHKLDSKNPSVKITAAGGTDLQKWNKSVSLNAVADEDIYSYNAQNKLTQGIMNMKLSDGKNDLSIYKYTYTPNSPGTYFVNQFVPALKNSSTTLNIALRDKIEGEYTLILSGRDFAGNEMTQTFGGIKLDNKPPEVTLTEEQTPIKTDGKKGNIYKVTLNDISGTGKLYYCFTEKPFAEAKNVTKKQIDDAKKQSSGEMSTLLDEWAFIDQSDAQKGASAYIEAEKGKNFKGRIVYFAVDAFGNQTEVLSKDIEIKNEDTLCSITPSAPDKPQSNYKITVTTNKNNKIYYRWRSYEKLENGSNYLFEKHRLANNGIIDTALDKETKGLNGTYEFECKIVPPSGENAKTYTRTYSFDNEGPDINITCQSAGEYKKMQTISVYAKDASDILEGYAKIVAPDGSDIPDADEFNLNISNGILSQNVNISDVKNGAYALKVRAKDTNGIESENISDVFFIRNSAPEGTVNVSSALSFGEKPLLSDEKLKLKFDIEEAFLNAGYSKDQSLYYRVGQTSDKYSDWIKAGDMAPGTDSLKASVLTDNVPFISLTEGENSLFVQTAVISGNDTTKIDIANVKNDEVVFYYDSTPPQARLVINDIHTSGSISGKLYLKDNLGNQFDVSCASGSVKISESRDEQYENAYDVTVSENVNTVITVKDEAKNVSTVKLIITGIDKTPPSADVNIKEIQNGERVDFEAVVTVKETDSKSVKFALIPTDEYNGSQKIDEKYFRENIIDNDSEFEFFKAIPARYDVSKWEGEDDVTYNVSVSGKEGSWYLAVRASDSLSNTADIVFDQTPITPKDPEITYDKKISPIKTNKKSVVTVNFNVPLYVLDQSRIATGDIGIIDTDGMTQEEIILNTNLALAKQNAAVFSTSYSFTVTENGTYDLYTADSLGRTKLIKVDVSGIEFDAVGDVKATTYQKSYSPDSVYGEENEYVKIEDGKMASVGEHMFPPVKVEIEPVNANTNLMPIEIAGDMGEPSGLNFDSNLSQRAETGSGFKKLVYHAQPLFDENGKLLNKNERIIDIFAFDETTSLDDLDPETDIISVVIDNIDNTGPDLSWSVSPMVYTYNGDIEGRYNLYNYTLHPTPGNIEYTVRIQDKESGITHIDLLQYVESIGPEGENVVTVNVPLFDENGKAIDYSDKPWTWDGNEHLEFVGGGDDTSLDEYRKIPVKIEYMADTDPKGIKTLTYTFSDEYYLKAAPFINSAGAETYCMLPMSETGINTYGLIYRMDIEEGADKDYTLKYYFENADGNLEEISDNGTYYKKAKAVIVKGDRADERGLFIANSNLLDANDDDESVIGAKYLDSYENSFTFKLKDKYGYTKDVTVNLENFDEEPGTIDYSLSATEKTNQPVIVTISVSDGKSGVGSVKLIGGEDEIILTKTEDGKYQGEILANGTYSIVMYDRAGNKAAKSFNVKNIDKTLPTATVSYSTKEFTSRPVTATLAFSKPNVRISKIEYNPSGTLTESDYSVDYKSSSITFLKSGTIDVYFVDEYGNTSVIDVTVGNIDKTPPSLEPIATLIPYENMVAIEFKKAENAGIVIDQRRELSDIFVTYGGITKRADYDGEIIDEKGNDKRFIFYENGNYTFKVHDEEGMTSFLTVEVTDIDKKAPKITYVSWEYEYDYIGENGQWLTAVRRGSVTPSEGKVGYVVAVDDPEKAEDKTNINPITNKDVTVKVETDDPTRIMGTDDELTNEKTRIYDENGLYIFNVEKDNKLSESYGVDIEVIDKEAPTIDLLGVNEFVFYENPNMGVRYDKSMLYDTSGSSYKAYDIFKGKVTDLTKDVKITDWGGFNPDDISKNTFDSSAPYTITYSVTDSAHNVTEAKRTIRLVGMYDTVALVNGALPDFMGRSEVKGDSIKISLANFSGTAYVRYQSGVKTMGQMKKEGEMISKNENGDFEVSNLTEGWYTFYIQTDKRDYFTLNVYLTK